MVEAVTHFADKEVETSSQESCVDIKIASTTADTIGSQFKVALPLTWKLHEKHCTADDSEL